MHWQNGYGHFVLIGSVVSLLGTFVCHSWVSEAPLSAQRPALPFAQLARTMPLGSPTESVQAILALSATTPANTSQMPSSDSLMGLAGHCRGSVDPSYL
jgi:hypothetical protein